MTRQRLNILYVSQMPASPPRFGAQARMHGLMTSMARHHDLTAVSLVDDEFDMEDCRRAMADYCREVVLLPNPKGKNGMTKRLLQLRSIASRRSFERHRNTVVGLQDVLDRLLRRERFDVVNLEFPFLAHYRLKQSPPGTPPPPLVVDLHDIAFDLARQFARNTSTLRRGYSAFNWRKLHREELSAYRAADGICTCSIADQKRLLAEVPSARTVVIPNAADVDFYQPREAYPPSDGKTVVYFGLMSTRPNIDGVTWFVKEIWPSVVAARPDARCLIIGKNAPRSVLDLAGPSVEIVGFVEDLRPHLSRAAALVVPLRLGSGTRLKIVEGMAMSKAIVSTRLGAEGIDVTHDENILLADEPASFARSVVRLLEDPALARRLGSAGRRLAVERYAWSSAADALGDFMRELIAARQPQVDQARSAM